MMFAIFFPVFLGVFISSAVFTLGMQYGWSGVDAMTYFYIAVASIAVILGMWPSKSINWRGGLKVKPEKEINLMKGGNQNV